MFRLYGQKASHPAVATANVSESKFKFKRHAANVKHNKMYERERESEREVARQVYRYELNTVRRRSHRMCVFFFFLAACLAACLMPQSHLAAFRRKIKKINVAKAKANGKVE